MIGDALELAIKARRWTDARRGAPSATSEARAKAELGTVRRRSAAASLAKRSASRGASATRCLGHVTQALFGSTTSALEVKRKWPVDMPACTGPAGIWCRWSPRPGDAYGADRRGPRPPIGEKSPESRSATAAVGRPTGSYRRDRAAARAGRRGCRAPRREASVGHSQVRPPIARIVDQRSARAVVAHRPRRSTPLRQEPRDLESVCALPTARGQGRCGLDLRAWGPFRSVSIYPSHRATFGQATSGGGRGRRQSEQRARCAYIGA